MWLVDLNYNFECDWLIELSDNKLSNNKLSDNNLAAELVENKTFLKPITIEEIVILMTNSKQEAKQYTENITAKLQNSNQNSTFSWVSLIGLWATCWPKSIC